MALICFRMILTVQNIELSKSGEKCFACDTTHRLVLVGSYYYCLVHQNKKKTQNDSYNGSEAHLTSLRKHFAKKKNRPDAEHSVAQTVNDNAEYFTRLLIPFKSWLLSKKVIIYDTESDGVGATWCLNQTREYHFYDIENKATLNVWSRTKNGRINPSYTHENARRDIRSFIQNADYLIAYEPPSNDRNRLKSLFGNDVYEALVEPKVIDFKRTIINSLITTDNSLKGQLIYLPGRTQPEVYDSLLKLGDVSHPEPQGFLPIPESWKEDIDMKCRVDVHMLHNLFIYFQSVLSQ